ncbi:MAG: Sua5 family C-terminal domain-containing protein, partial [Marinobacter sp.]
DFPKALQQLASPAERLGAVWFQHAPPESTVAEAIQLGADPEAYARMLYTALHTLDQAGLTRILVELPPATEPWRAINDRLSRACSQ